MGLNRLVTFIEERRRTRKFSESNILRFTIPFGSRFCSGVDWMLAVWRQALGLLQTQGHATHRVCLKTAQLLH